MEDARTVILPTCVAVDDELGIQQIFELFAAAAGADWAQLDLRPRRSEHRKTLTYGSPPSTPPEPITLDISEDIDATLMIDGCAPPDTETLARFKGAMTREFHRQRLLAETTLLRGGLEATSAAVLLFGPTGSILYANGPADRLLSMQTEDELTVEWVDEGPQPLFRLLCSQVSLLLEGVRNDPWQSRLELSDGTERTCEIVPLQTGTDGFGRVVLAILREVGLPPDRRVAEFATQHRLSPREREVLRLLVRGFDTTELADRLGISPHTVRDHLKHVFRKTSSRSRSEVLSAIAAAGNR